MSKVIRLSDELVELIKDYQNFKANCFTEYANHFKDDSFASATCLELAKNWREKSLSDVLLEIVKSVTPNEGGSFNEST